MARAMNAPAIRWTCARCQVSVGRLDGARSEVPDTWSSAEGLIYCLSCSRTRAAEFAGEAAPDETSSEDKARLRRRAIIAFEIGRTPEAPNRTIASACRTSSKTVANVREEMLTVPSLTGRAEARGV
jgi:hypothetical protein